MHSALLYKSGYNNPEPWLFSTYLSTLFFLCICKGHIVGLYTLNAVQYVKIRKAYWFGGFLLPLFWFCICSVGWWEFLEGDVLLNKFPVAEVPRGIYR